MNKDQQQTLRCLRVMEKISWLSRDRLIPAEEALDWINQYLKDYSKGRDVSITDEWMKKVDGIDPEKRMRRLPFGTKPRLLTSRRLGGE